MVEPWGRAVLGLDHEEHADFPLEALADHADEAAHENDVTWFVP